MLICNLQWNNAETMKWMSLWDHFPMRNNNRSGQFICRSPKMGRLGINIASLWVNCDDYRISQYFIAFRLCFVNVSRFIAVYQFINKAKQITWRIKNYLPLISNTNRLINDRETRAVHEKKVKHYTIYILWNWWRRRSVRPGC